MTISYLQPAGLVTSSAFSHVAVVPPGATTIYVGGQNGVDETGTVLADVVQWTVLFVDGVDLAAAYGAISPRLARDGAPPLVVAAGVAALGVPGALIEVSAIATRTP